MTRQHRDPIDRCTDCPIGIASGEGRGQFCPFIPRDLRAGDVVFEQDTEPHHVYFVRRGLVELTRARDRRESCAHEVGPGRYVGVEAMMPGRHAYSHTARAKSDAILCTASTEGIDQWLGPTESPARTALTIVLADPGCEE